MSGQDFHKGQAHPLLHEVSLAVVCEMTRMRES
jgi:hypothetical protein